MPTGDDTPLGVWSGVKWRIMRHGENILWGAGVLRLEREVFEDEGYSLIIEDANAPIPNNPQNFVIVDDHWEDPNAPDNYRGFAHGEVYHKMVPEASPDISAVLMARAEPPSDPDVSR